MVLEAPWQGASPPHDLPLRFAERLGCDPEPLDPRRAEDRLTLTSYVWADQRERFERLRGALQVAAAHPVPVQRATASQFLSEQLQPRPGTATVVWHSVVRQYLGPDERERMRRLVEGAGQSATAEAPIARLALEPDSAAGVGGFALSLTTWPDGEHRVLADCHGHGPPVLWL